MNQCIGCLIIGIIISFIYFTYTDKSKKENFMGGCATTQYGCCPGTNTAQKDKKCSNCKNVCTDPRYPHASSDGYDICYSDDGWKEGGKTGSSPCLNKKGYPNWCNIAGGSKPGIGCSNAQSCLEKGQGCNDPTYPHLSPNGKDICFTNDGWNNGGNKGNELPCSNKKGVSNWCKLPGGKNQGDQCSKAPACAQVGQGKCKDTKYPFSDPSGKYDICYSAIGWGAGGKDGSDKPGQPICSQEGNPTWCTIQGGVPKPGCTPKQPICAAEDPKKLNCEINPYSDFDPDTNACENRTYPGVLGMGMAADLEVGIPDKNCQQPPLETTFNPNPPIGLPIDTKNYCYNVKTGKISFSSMMA